MMILGAVGSLDLVWSLAAVTMGVMAVINLVAIALLGVLDLRLLADYQDQRSRGLDPTFSQGPAARGGGHPVLGSPVRGRGRVRPA